MRANLVPMTIVVTLMACQRPAPPHSGSALLDPGHATAMIDSVRSFAESVALGVTSRGPAAWRTYFADEPAFFMAADGRLAFPNSDAVSRAIPGLARAIPHIELRWGDSVIVDPLAPGLAMFAAPYRETQTNASGHRVQEDGFFTGIAEHRPVGWQFRDAHWSDATPPTAVP